LPTAPEVGLLYAASMIRLAVASWRWRRAELSPPSASPQRAV